MAGVVHVQWYATVLRQDLMAAELARVTPLSLRYGATEYKLHRSNDDRYLIRQMIWFEDKAGWHRYWEGPEMSEFRRRHMGHYTIPLAYVWHDEIAAGALGPEVPLEPMPAPQPEPAPQTAA